MAISISEAEDLISRIETRARELSEQSDRRGVLDLLNQWRADVEAGKPVERRLTVKQSPGIDRLSDLPMAATTTSGDFVGRRDFSASEKLEMLLYTVGISLIAPAMMARRILDTIEKFSRNANGEAVKDVVINRVGLREMEISRPSRLISGSTVEESLNCVRQLAELLQEVADEAGLKTIQFNKNEEPRRAISE